MQDRVINNTNKTIAATNTLISEAIYTGQRAVLILKNTSTAGETISLGVGVEAKDGVGLVLKAGETITFSKDTGYNPTNERFNAVDDGAGTGTIAIYEEIMLKGDLNGS